MSRPRPVETPVHRLFLDVNVLFSAVYGTSFLSRLWELAREGMLIYAP